MKEERVAWFELHCKCPGSPGNAIKAKDVLTASAFRSGELVGKCGGCQSDIVFKEIGLA